ncbi:MAG: hypothetical protein K2X12_19540, partial [Burkholderiaceae bacterium]|nr:hypothetical protein [Burkholderiaceae bacterium]
NRTVKRVSADDSADSRVKVGHRQAIYPAAPAIPSMVGVLLCKRHFAINSRARVPFAGNLVCVPILGGRHPRFAPNIDKALFAVARCRHVERFHHSMGQATSLHHQITPGRP